MLAADFLLGKTPQLHGDLHFWRAAAWQERALLYETPQHAERVMKRALRLVEHELIRAAQKNRDRFARSV